MHWLETGEAKPDPDLAEQYAVLTEHYELMLEHYGIMTGVNMAASIWAGTPRACMAAPSSATASTSWMTRRW
jgi:tRNA-dihydrouridine synthase